MACLGDVCKIVGGGTPSRKVSDYWGGGIPWATVKDLGSDRITKTLESVSQDGLSNSASKLVPAGTVLVVTRVGLGKVSIADIDVGSIKTSRRCFRAQTCYWSSCSGA